MKRLFPLTRALPLALLVLANATPAQTAAAPKADAAANGEAAHEPVAAFAWLAGCWKGSVNGRDFREMWLPPQAGMMIGAGSLAQGDRMQDYQFLRLEPRADGVHFTQFSGDLKEISFRLARKATDGDDTIFTFANVAAGFPERLVYRRGQEGWLYETVAGTQDGADHQVIYPLRRISCETGELIRK